MTTNDLSATSSLCVCRTPRPPAVARGFSLVEVLIAVVVLALGVLGLAAIFPAVIAQQRNAQSETLGSVVSSTAKIMLQRQTSTLGWDRLDRDVTLSSNGNCLNAKLDGLWGVFDWGGNEQPLNPRVLNTYRDTGALLFGGGYECTSGGGMPLPTSIPFFPDNTNPDPLFAHERLLPEPFSGPDPQFVWDFVPRKVGSGGGRTTLQVAVFVRRIDANIRVPAGKKLAQLFYTDDDQVPPAAFPVAVEVGGTRDGMPSNNGKGKYAVPRNMSAQTKQADVVSGKVKIVNLKGNDANQIRLASQPGQKLVDNLGVVRTVVKAIADSSGKVTGVEVSPALDAGETPNMFATSEAARLLQVVYTPQVPVDVVIFTP